MRRRNWREIEDMSWCPAWLRDAMTGYLQTVVDVARPYDVAAPILGELIETSGCTSVLDLASGGGGPWPGLRARMGSIGAGVSVTLCDIEPSGEAAIRFARTPGFEYLTTPVSALDPPRTDHGMWTMFTSLHHFQPADVRRIMSTAQSRGVMFCAFEATSRSGRGVAVSLLIPLLVLLFMPRVRPRRLLPLLLTYLPPILPFLIWWDGLASTLRTYTVAELEEIARELSDERYQWKVREIPVPGAPIPVLSLTGLPTGVTA